MLVKEPRMAVSTTMGRFPSSSRCCCCQCLKVLYKGRGEERVSNDSIREYGLGSEKFNVMKRKPQGYSGLTSPCLSEMLFVSFSLWNDTTFCIHCSPVVGLSGWMYILFGISGSALPAMIHRLEKKVKGISIGPDKWDLSFQFLFFSSSSRVFSVCSRRSRLKKRSQLGVGARKLHHHRAG